MRQANRRAQAKGGQTCDVCPVERVRTPTYTAGTLGAGRCCSRPTNVVEVVVMEQGRAPRRASHTRRRFLGRAALALAGAVALPALTGERAVLAATLPTQQAPVVHAAQAGNILRVSQSVDLSSLHPWVN